MILGFVYFGTLLAFAFALGAFFVKREAAVLASVLFVVLAILVGSYGVDVPVDQTVTITEHSVAVDANTTDTNTVQSIQTVYENYGFSDPFVFSVVWIFLGLGVAFAIFTFSH